MTLNGASHWRRLFSSSTNFMSLYRVYLISIQFFYGFNSVRQMKMYNTITKKNYYINDDDDNDDDDDDDYYYYYFNNSWPAHHTHTHIHTHTHLTRNYICSHIYQHFIITTHCCIVLYHFNNSQP
jgi:hypothetical protein